ncbi:hypothetical protein [Paenibacillus monticola]|uniref:Copper amine oxidase-like N-terminal domain-containing protein n=1 Tax=Paenibacillus monticola TaxID=2666075 RepID=A0A7X2HB54_9BACL|nr:hypothetical protein [Paenibacillus monticola]MRN56862.1 hypothetical protein [Paenibacillus monticola]
MKFKKVTLMALATLLLGGTVAYGATNEVKAVFTNLKYKVSGVAWTPSAKNSPKPVIINGSTYIPISVITEATKTNIAVDKVSNTLIIGERANSTPLNKESIKFKSRVGYSQNPAYTIFDDKNYEEVIAAPGISYDAEATFYPNKKYQTLTINAFVIGDKGDTAEIHLVNSATNEELKTIMLEPDTGITSTEVNVAGVSEIAVRFKSFDGVDFVVLPTSQYK